MAQIHSYIYIYTHTHISAYRHISSTAYPAFGRNVICCLILAFIPFIRFIRHHFTYSAFSFTFYCFFNFSLIKYFLCYLASPFSYTQLFELCVCVPKNSVSVFIYYLLPICKRATLDAEYVLLVNGKHWLSTHVFGYAIILVSHIRRININGKAMKAHTHKYYVKYNKNQNYTHAINECVL